MKTKLLITITIVFLFNFISNAQTVKPKQTGATAQTAKKMEIKKATTSTLTIKVEHDENFQYYIVNSKTGERIKTLYGYSFVSDFSDGLARGESNGKWGYIDTKGETVIVAGLYEAARNFSEGLAPVRFNGKWRFIDKSNNENIDDESYYWLKDLRYEDAYSFNEGLAAVKHNNKWGFINKSGLVIDYKYEDTYSFNEGLAAAKLNGKWGFINKEDKVVIPFEFEKAKSFSNGLAEVVQNGVSFSIDKMGKKVSSVVK